MPLAGRGARLGGHLVDLVLYLLAALVPVLVLWDAEEPIPPRLPAERWEEERSWEQDRVWEQFEASRRPSPIPRRVMLFSGIGAILMLIAQCVPLVTRGQSIGKILVKTRIVDHETGRHPGAVRIIGLRTVLPSVLAHFVPFFGVIDACLIFGDKQRCLHDHMAGTSVVRAASSRHDDPARVFD